MSVAVKDKNIEIVRMLLAHKCDPNFISGGGERSLNIAVGKGSVEIAKLLLNYDANLNLIEIGAFLESR